MEKKSYSFARSENVPEDFKKSVLKSLKYAKEYSDRFYINNGKKEAFNKFKDKINEIRKSEIRSEYTILFPVEFAFGSINSASNPKKLANVSKDILEVGGFKRGRKIPYSAIENAYYYYKYSPDKKNIYVVYPCAPGFIIRDYIAIEFICCDYKKEISDIVESYFERRQTMIVSREEYNIPSLNEEGIAIFSGDECESFEEATGLEIIYSTKNTPPNDFKNTVIRCMDTAIKYSKDNAKGIDKKIYHTIVEKNIDRIKKQRNTKKSYGFLIAAEKADKFIINPLDNPQNFAAAIDKVFKAGGFKRGQKIDKTENQYYYYKLSPDKKFIYVAAFATIRRSTLKRNSIMLIFRCCDNNDDISSIVESNYKENKNTITSYNEQKKETLNQKMAKMSKYSPFYYIGRFLVTGKPTRKIVDTGIKLGQEIIIDRCINAVDSQLQNRLYYTEKDITIFSKFVKSFLENHSCGKKELDNYISKRTSKADLQITHSEDIDFFFSSGFVPTCRRSLPSVKTHLYTLSKKCTTGGTYFKTFCKITDKSKSIESQIEKESKTKMNKDEKEIFDWINEEFSHYKTILKIINSDLNTIIDINNKINESKKLTILNFNISELYSERGQNMTSLNNDFIKEETTTIFDDTSNSPFLTENGTMILDSDELKSFEEATGYEPLPPTKEDVPSDFKKTVIRCMKTAIDYSGKNNKGFEKKFYHNSVVKKIDKIEQNKKIEVGYAFLIAAEDGDEVIKNALSNPRNLANEADKIFKSGGFKRGQKIDNSDNQYYYYKLSPDKKFIYMAYATTKSTTFKTKRNTIFFLFRCCDNVEAISNVLESGDITVSAAQKRNRGELVNFSDIYGTMNKADGFNYDSIKRSQIFNEAVNKYCDISHRPTKQYLLSLDEAGQNAVVNNLTSKLYDKIVKKCEDIDYGEIPATKGDITKLSKYEDMKETVIIIHNLLKEYKQDPSPIDEITVAMSNIESRKNLFEKAYRYNSELPMVMYCNVVLGIISGISYMIGTCIEFIKDPGTNTFKIALDRTSCARTKDHTIYNALKGFNRSCKNKEFDKAIDAIMNTQAKNFAGLAIGGVALGVIGTLLVLIPILRELIFLFYYTRVQISDFFNIQADLLTLNAYNIEANNEFTKKDKKEIINKQTKYIDSFRKIANTLSFEVKKGEVAADKEKRIDDNENKKRIDKDDDIFNTSYSSNGSLLF